MVGMDKEIEITKTIINEVLKNSGIALVDTILFGSRVKGSHKKDSDWDFLIVVNEELSFNDKWALILKIKRRLAKLRIPNDIIIKSKKQLESQMADVGRIAYYAFKEGIQV